MTPSRRRRRPAFPHVTEEPGAYLDGVALPLTVQPAPSQVACPDCPAIRQGVFEHMIKGPRASCAFQCLTIENRAQIPDRWFGTYGVALIRRGVMVRQRVDAQGRATAVDAAGPGCLVSLNEPAGPTGAAAYAATRLLVCLCPNESIDRELELKSDGTAPDLVRMQREQIDRLERVADARGRTTVQSKVSALLCTLADTLSPPRRRSRIPSGLQQRDMALLLGVRHESVCRALGQLEKKGAVRREPDGIRITDRTLLETI